jgi:hypothetical protein
MTEHRLCRYSTKDGGYVYTRGKTDALRECRKHAKLTSSDITLEVEEVVTKDMTTKTLLLALMNGEDVLTENAYDGTVLSVPIASVKGRLKPSKPAPEPRPEPEPRETGDPDEPKPKTRKYSPYLETDDSDEEEYVTIWSKTGFRLLKLNALSPGTKVLTSKNRVVTW